MQPLIISLFYRLKGEVFLVLITESDQKVAKCEHSTRLLFRSPSSHYPPAIRNKNQVQVQLANAIISSIINHIPSPIETFEVEPKNALNE
jgi:hypothetical protein